MNAKYEKSYKLVQFAPQVPSFKDWRSWLFFLWGLDVFIYKFPLIKTELLLLVLLFLLF